MTTEASDAARSAPPSRYPLTCRGCAAPLARVFVDLGSSPLANSYLDPADLAAAERFYPLAVYVCERCWLCQLPEAASPAEIFGDYAYFSSYSTSWLEHARRYVDAMISRFGLGAFHQVVEIASNDGYLLRWFRERGVPVLGVEPAANVAAAARELGIPTEVRLFGLETARDLVAPGLAADLALGNNVLAHVPDLDDFVAGIAVLLKPGGLATIEFPHLVAGRLSASDLAGVALGSCIYATVFVGFMATLQALTPIAGHHFGAHRFHEIGTDVAHALWLALFLTLLALPLLLFNEPPLRLIGAPAEVAAISAHYLWAIAVGLPAALASRVYIALNAALSRRTVTMLINLGALAAKVPLNLLFIHGAGPLPAMGGAGCGMATAMIMWLMLLAHWLLWRLDPFYRRFHPGSAAPRGPTGKRQRELLRLGLPSGGMLLIEISSFTFIALLLARFGATIVAGHQILANVIGLLFMLPLSYGIAASVLVAQAA